MLFTDNHTFLCHIISCSVHFAKLNKIIYKIENVFGKIENVFGNNLENNNVKCVYI